MYFGEIEIIQQIPRLDTAQAPVETDLLIMPRSLLIEISDEFPHIYKEMTDIAEQR